MHVESKIKKVLYYLLNCDFLKKYFAKFRSLIEVSIAPFQIPFN